MVNPTNSDGNSSDTTNQAGKMERNSRMMALQQRMNRLEIKEVEYMRFKDYTSRSTTTMNISQKDRC
jgi:hypothetical protein